MFYILLSLFQLNQQSTSDISRQSVLAILLGFIWFHSVISYYTDLVLGYMCNRLVIKSDTLC